MTKNYYEEIRQHDDLEREADFDDIRDLYRLFLMPTLSQMTSDKDMQRWGKLKRSFSKSENDKDLVTYELESSVDEKGEGMQYKVILCMDNTRTLDELSDIERTQMLGAVQRQFEIDDIDPDAYVDDEDDEEQQEWWVRLNDKAQASEIDVIETIQYEYVITNGGATKNFTVALSVDGEDIDEFFMGDDEDSPTPMATDDTMVDFEKLWTTMADVTSLHMEDIARIKHILETLGFDSPRMRTKKQLARAARKAAMNRGQRDLDDYRRIFETDEYAQ